MIVGRLYECSGVKIIQRKLFSKGDKKVMKKDNKGFSLVELIVVVLIMGILAVALTPQVMKWVNNSRLSADKQTQEAVVSNCQLAMVESGALAAAPASFTISSSGLSVTPAADNKFYASLAKVSGVAVDKLQKAYTTKTKDNTITITIDKTNGSVTGSMSKQADLDSFTKDN